MRESEIKKYRAPKWLREGVSKNEVEEVVKDKILDPIDTSIKKTIKPSGSKNIYSILNTPNESDPESREIKAVRAETEIQTEQDTGNKEDYPILTNIKRRVASDLKKEDIPVASDISDTTPTILAEFQEEPFDTDSIFQVVLGFKDNISMTKETAAQEEYIAVGLALLLNGGNIENISNTEIKDLTEDLKKAWIKSFTLTLNALKDRDDLFDKGDEYVTCREDSVFEYNSSTGNVDRVNRKSVFKVIKDATKVRSLFPKGLQRDAWNPSDVYVIRKRYYNEFCSIWNDAINELKKESDENNPKGYAGLNAILRQELSERNVIGISLKKTSSANIEIENGDEVAEDYQSLVLGSPEQILVPELQLYSDELHKKNLTRSGMLFRCEIQTKPIDFDDPNSREMFLNYKKEQPEEIKFYFRRFSTESPSMTIEPIRSKMEARIGKAPISLIQDFESSINDELEDNTLPQINRLPQTKVIDRLNKETSALFLNDDPIAHEEYIRKMSLILGQFSLRTPDNEPVINQKWEGFINDPEVQSVVRSNQKSGGLVYAKLRDWVQIINFLYVLAYLKSKRDGSFEKSLAKLHDWAKKVGYRFAPYVLVS